MDPFSNDPFEDIINEFFGNRSRRPNRVVTSEQEERIIDFIEDSKNIYIVFEIPGYNEEDVNIKLQGNKIEVIGKKKNLQRVQSYLQRKLQQGIRISKNLPEVTKKKKYSYSVKNGILEVKFKK